MSNVYVGSMGWSYDFWKPSFYPKSLPSSDFLTYYSKQFNSVEVDNTFYRIPRSQTVLDWKRQTPPGFLFSLKFPRVITHVKVLWDCEEETRVFLERVDLLGEKLGALLLQFPATFKNEQLDLLHSFLQDLPKGPRYVVEMRNPKLFNERLSSILRESKVALAWVEGAALPLIDEVTSDFIYVRWEGDRSKVNGTIGKVELDKKADIRMWAEKFKHICNEKMLCFGYFSKYYSGFPPADVQEFNRNIGARE